MQTLPIQQCNVSLERASKLVEGLYPGSISLHRVRLTFLYSLGLDAILPTMEALRGTGQTQSSASLEVKESSVACQNLERRRGKM